MLDAGQMIYAIALILLALLPDPPVCDPALTRLFTPAAPGRGRYEVCVIDRTLDAGRPEGFTFGTVEHLEALDAFGAAGSYDRARLARLYGGRRVDVLRGWRRDASALESITLLSPYPDGALSRLQPGTMIIRYRLSTLIAMSPFTTSTDSTGSPDPIVVSPNRGPN